MNALYVHFIMSTISNLSFSIHIKILNFFFLYPPKNSTSYKLKSYILYFFMALHVPILGILYFVLKEDIDMKTVSDNGFALAEMCCYVPKIFSLLLKARRIKRCIHYFDNPVFKTLIKDQEEIIEKAVHTCRKSLKFFLICVSAGFASWALTPLLFLETSRTPIDIWLPFELDGNKIRFYVVYIWVVLGVGYTAIIGVAIDPLIAGLACLGAAYFTALKRKLQNLDASISQNPEIVFEKILECVKHHQRLLKFGKLYEECFSQVVFYQFFGSIFVLGFCCLQLSMLPLFGLDFLATINYLVILLAQIYFYCYYGTTLFDESNTLTTAIYMGKWYECDVKSRKTLILLMERSKKPVKITAGKLFDLSLDTFTNILRKSYSVLAVFNNQK